ncbi:hypothetical protein Ami103574_10940 [Aminipila butyrica]|uniref:Uncharacterized protein n=1 Tax=Aminipila butyrica TaxID=433296 RepID=A0A858BXJ8_9FIRM|nr:hypothetical protein [Aminipila butyrica]QIB69805.1 hypothetical protein Ami103574_10940 [Aminipila butyrica]
MNKTQEQFLNNTIKKGNTVIFQTEQPKKGDIHYGEYIYEHMIMTESIEVGSVISVNISGKTYIGAVLNLWEGGFKLLLDGRKEWKDGSNTRSFSYKSVDEVIKLN